MSMDHDHWEAGLGNVGSGSRRENGFAEWGIQLDMELGFDSVMLSSLFCPRSCALALHEICMASS